jgi:hypothetical protein
VRAEPVGERPDPGHAVVAALGDDVDRTVVDRELPPGLVPAHCDDAVRAEPFGRQHGEQTDSAVADDRDGLAGAAAHAQKVADAALTAGHCRPDGLIVISKSLPARSRSRPGRIGGSRLSPARSR